MSNFGNNEQHSNFADIVDTIVVEQLEEVHKERNQKLNSLTEDLVHHALDDVVHKTLEEHPNVKWTPPFVPTPHTYPSTLGPTNVYTNPTYEPALDGQHQELFKNEKALADTTQEVEQRVVETGREWTDATINAANQAREVAAVGVEQMKEMTETVKDVAAVAAEKGKEASDYVMQKGAEAVGATMSAAGVAAEIATEKGKELKEYMVEKGSEAKDFVTEKAAQAKELAQETGEYLNEKGEEALEEGANWTEWTKEKAATAKDTLLTASSVAQDAANQLEHAVVDTGLSLLGKAAGMLQSLKNTTFHVLHPEGVAEGSIPKAPEAPAVYVYPTSSVRPYVKYGDKNTHEAFTSELLRAVNARTAAVHVNKIPQERFPSLVVASPMQ